MQCSFSDNADRIGVTNVALKMLCQRQVVDERAMCQLAYSNGEEHTVQLVTSHHPCGGGY